MLGGFKAIDASGQALIYVYARETRIRSWHDPRC